MTRTELIAALEAASGPSRKLDVEIKCHLEPHWDDPQRRSMMLSDEGVVRCPYYTESIDAALSFTPDEWSYVCMERYSDGWYVRLKPKSFDQEHVTSSQKPAAIALCIANLRAIEAQGTSQ